MSKSKGAKLRQYIQSGYFAYGVKYDANGNSRLVAVPPRGAATLDDLLEFLDKEEIEYYVKRASDESDFDEVGNGIDGCAVDLEVLEWLELFERDSDGQTYAPLTIANIPALDIELGADSTDEEVLILGDILTFVAELRLIKGLEAGQSLDEAIM